jgi:transposase
VLSWWAQIEVLIITGVTSARTKAASPTIKNIKRTEGGFTNADNCRTRVLLPSAARSATRTLSSAPVPAQP